MLTIKKNSILNLRGVGMEKSVKLEKRKSRNEVMAIIMEEVN